MSDTLDLSELTLQESGKMDNYEETGFEGPELQLEASASEADEASETNDSFSRVDNFGSGGSLRSDQSIHSDEVVEAVEEVKPVATVSREDDEDQDNQDLQYEGDASPVQKEGLDQVEDNHVEAGTAEDIKDAPKKSKWLTRYFQRQEELY